MSPNSSTVSASLGGGDADPSAASGEFMLFGVRVVVDSMRKSVSMNNLSQYEQLPNESSNNPAGGNKEKEDVPAGYASADDVVTNNSGVSRERKRGVPWTEEEHKLFLLGLQKVGKGDWRGISRNFVKTRTPTQVASHAQKYFLRRNNLNRRRRRSSLFDITTDSVGAIPMDQDKVNTQDNASLSPTPPEAQNVGGFAAGTPYPAGTISPVSFTVDQAMTKPLCPVPESSPVDPLSLSLRLSLSSDQTDSSSFHPMSRFNIISVA